MMEAANQEGRIVQHEPVYNPFPIPTVGVVIENLVIEDPSAESWNSALEKLKLLDMNFNTTSVSNPELMCQFLFKKLEEVGCREKNSARNIAQFISTYLNRGFLYFQLLLPNDFPLDFYPSHVRNVLLQSEVDYFKLLLNYGLLQPIDIHSEDGLREVSSTIESMINIPETEQQNFYVESFKILLQTNFLLNKLQSSDGKFKGSFQRGFKRLMLTAKCVRALQKPHGQNGDDQYYAQCMRLYFRGFTDPSVQAEEVREFLSFFLVHEKKEAIDAMVTVFQRLFPESVAPYKPRSLQHLCRCQVREVLSPKSEALPELVKNLKIPQKLKMYILGDF